MSYPPPPPFSHPFFCPGREIENQRNREIAQRRRQGELRKRLKPNDKKGLDLVVLYISLPSLLHCDVKPSNFTFCGEC